MNGVNILPSRKAVLLDAIDPVSTATTVTTGWIDMKGIGSFQAIVLVGALGTNATVDAKLEQALTSGGGTPLDVPGKAITQLTKAGSDDNKQAVINCRADELTVNSDYRWVRLSITVGTAASLVSGLLLGHETAFDPLDVQNASVDEVVD